MSELPEEMRAEFDTVAAWTRAAVDELGPDHALPAACRGSGSPAALSWLCAQLRLGPGARLLDCGAGIGGPAAFAREQLRASPLLVDPMKEACVAARTMFGLPSVLATAEQLPFAAGTFATAWCLGVLSTTTNKDAVLRELARVLQPGGRLGLLTLVSDGAVLEETPAGNEFVSEARLRQHLDEAQLDVDDQLDAAMLPSPPTEWETRAARVESLLELRHAHDPRWQAARHQQDLMARLLGGGHVRTVLVSAVKSR